MASPNLICCGGKEVFVISPRDPDVKRWSWTAPDSPQLPESMHKAFHTTDECKPYHPGLLLITSSGGGVALIERDGKACLFWGRAINAHSACLLPGGRIAVAASFGGDEVVIFDRRQPGAQPLERLPLRGAHGVHWQDEQRILWALGDAELLRLSLLELAQGAPGLRVDQRWTLPATGGHDLSPLPDGAGFFVTTDTSVYRYSFATQRFEPDPDLGSAGKVKSVDQVLANGPIVYQQASEKKWWSDEIRLIPNGPAIKLEGERLYKVRWDEERKSP